LTTTPISLARVSHRQHLGKRVGVDDADGTSEVTSTTRRPASMSMTLSEIPDAVSMSR
jgi:hypothetical protein